MTVILEVVFKVSDISLKCLTTSELKKLQFYDRLKEQKHKSTEPSIANFQIQFQ